MMRPLLAAALLSITATLALAQSEPAPPAPAVDDGGAPPQAAPEKPKFKNVPPYFLDQRKLSGDVPRLPDVVKIQRMGLETVGMYKICVGTDGAVASVATVLSVKGADDAVIKQLKEWKFKPQPIGICSMNRFVWTIHR
jgi:hypothetical protein